MYGVVLHEAACRSTGDADVVVKDTIIRDGVVKSNDDGRFVEFRIDGTFDITRKYTLKLPNASKHVTEYGLIVKGITLDSKTAAYSHVAAAYGKTTHDEYYELFLHSIDFRYLTSDLQNDRPMAVVRVYLKDIPDGTVVRMYLTGEICRPVDTTKNNIVWTPMTTVKTSNFSTPSEYILDIPICKKNITDVFIHSNIPLREIYLRVNGYASDVRDAAYNNLQLTDDGLIHVDNLYHFEVKHDTFPYPTNLVIDTVGATDVTVFELSKNKLLYRGGTVLRQF